MNARSAGAILLAVALGLGACASPTGGGAPRGSAPEAQKPAAVKRVVAAIRGAAYSLSQAKTQRTVGSVAGLDAVEALVHVGLTATGAQGRAPRLAEAIPSVENGLWKLFPDGRMETTWTLKPIARWHDGVPVTSEDLLFAVAVEQDAEIGMPRNQIYDLIESVDAPDAKTVTVKWRQPYIEADAIFGYQAALPLPRHLLEAPFGEDKAGFFGVAYWTQNFIGAGPYKMREWVPDSHVVLQAYDHYVLGRPRIDEIEVRFIPDPNTVVANLLAGTVELTLGRGPSFEQGLQLLESWRDGRVIFQPGGYIVITPQLLNPSPRVVAELRFRRALLYAVDRQHLADTLMAGQSSIGHTFISPDQTEYQAIEGSIVRYEYDPRRAMEMIQELGYIRGPDAFFYDIGAKGRLSVEISTTVQNDMHLKAMPATADYWKQVGVTVDQVPIPLQRIQDREYRATFPAFTLGLMSIGLSPQDIRRYHSASTPLPENRFQITGNTARYRSPELDAIIERYVTTIPRQQRLAALAQLIDHQTDQVTIMGLFHYVNPTMVGRRLEHVTGRSAGFTEAWNAHEWDVK